MNPLAKFVSASIVGMGLMFTLSVASSVAVLVGVCALVLFERIPMKSLLRVITTLAALALLSAVSTVLYGRANGQVFWSWGLVNISEGSINLAVILTLRVFAIGLPAVLLMRNIDATELADSLTQLWSLPRRFVMATLASVRMSSLMFDDWETLKLARRARGLGSGRGPVLAVRRVSGQVFALLVLSIRRGTSLALAMEARGLSRSTRATSARTACWRKRDWMLVGAASFVTVIALVANG